MPSNGLTVTLPIHDKQYFTDGKSNALANDPNSNAVQGMPALNPAASRP